MKKQYVNLAAELTKFMNRTVSSHDLQLGGKHPPG